MEHPRAEGNAEYFRARVDASGFLASRATQVSREVGEEGSPRRIRIPVGYAAARFRRRPSKHRALVGSSSRGPPRRRHEPRGPSRPSPPPVALEARRETKRREGARAEELRVWGGASDAPAVHQYRMEWTSRGPRQCQLSRPETGRTLSKTRRPMARAGARVGDPLGRGPGEGKWPVARSICHRPRCVARHHLVTA